MASPRYFQASSSSQSSQQNVLPNTYVQELENDFKRRQEMFTLPRRSVYYDDILTSDYLSSRYNPFKLTLPYTLKSADKFFDALTDEYSDEKLDPAEVAPYFTFLDQYTTAYLTFLRALNNDKEAIVTIKTLFSSRLLFENAGMIAVDKNKDYQQMYVLSLLAHLTLDVVTSEDERIGTLARIRALNFLREHFDIEKVATAFAEFNWEFSTRSALRNPLCDLIPLHFITHPSERGPQNEALFKNKKFKEIFGYTEDYEWLAAKVYGIDLTKGISKLINEYPAQALQVLHSLVRVTWDNHSFINPDIIFKAILSLASIPDDAHRNLIFSERASFRHDRHLTALIEAAQEQQEGVRYHHLS